MCNFFLQKAKKVPCRCRKIDGIIFRHLAEFEKYFLSLQNIFVKCPGLGWNFADYFSSKSSRPVGGPLSPRAIRKRKENPTYTKKKRRMGKRIKHRMLGWNIERKKKSVPPLISPLISNNYFFPPPPFANARNLWEINTSNKYSLRTRASESVAPMDEKLLLPPPPQGGRCGQRFFCPVVRTSGA